jgi:altronate dehydratase
MPLPGGRHPGAGGIVAIGLSGNSTSPLPHIMSDSDLEKKHIVIDADLFEELKEKKLEHGLTWTGLLARADYSPAEVVRP